MPLTPTYGDPVVPVATSEDAVKHGVDSRVPVATLDLVISGLCVGAAHPVQADGHGCGDAGGSDDK